MTRKSTRLPKRFPVGTTYVVEGARNAKGVFQVTRRYVQLPSGRQVDLPVGGRAPVKAAVAPSLPRSARDLLPRGRTTRTQPRAAL